MNPDTSMKKSGYRDGPLRRRVQSGASLIEVLVAVMILGVGLLGIGAMQTIALRNGQSSLERTQAVIQSYAILDVIRANRANALAGYYNTGNAPRCAASAIDTGDPAGQQSAQGEVNTWVGSLKTAMGGGAADTTTCGLINCEGNTIDGATCTVAVQWDDSRGTGASAAADDEEDGDDEAVATGEGSASRRVVTVAAI